jgi:penicillin-binding protein 1A
LENKAEQYYPTYKSSERDILLVEFEEAQKIANGQNKVYAQVANILLAAATFLFTTFYKEGQSTALPKYSFSTSVSVSIFMYISGAMLLRYFVDLQRQITINARKVVTLRTLLGLDYGNIQLTLPNWRVEGATNPFVIKYFNGWLAFKTTPFWLLTIFVNLVWFLAVHTSTAYRVHFYAFEFNISWLWGNIIITISYLYIFRANLNDRHETNFLNLVKICLFPFLNFVDNFEYILYRAKLSYMELDRLGVNYEEFKKVLVAIEDNRFHSHRGISFKSIIRAGLSRFSYFRGRYNYIQNGASTISMQLSRSLFIPSNQNKFFRKVAEIRICLLDKK